MGSINLGRDPFLPRVLSRGASELRHISVASFMVLLLIQFAIVVVVTKANLMPLLRGQIAHVFCG
jgi:hypothetical protein